LLLIIKDTVVRDSLFLIQRLEPLLVDGREVDEDILTPIIGGDEAKALVAEEFNLAGGAHDDVLLKENEGLQKTVLQLFPLILSRI
jgi:hypothetical protein